MFRNSHKQNHSKSPPVEIITEESHFPQVIAIIYEILKFLTVKDLIAMSQVNRLLRNIINGVVFRENIWQFQQLLWREKIKTHFADQQPSINFRTRFIELYGREYHAVSGFQELLFTLVKDNDSTRLIKIIRNTLSANKHPEIFKILKEHPQKFYDDIKFRNKLKKLPEISGLSEQLFRVFTAKDSQENQLLDTIIDSTDQRVLDFFYWIFTNKLKHPKNSFEGKNLIYWAVVFKQSLPVFKALLKHYDVEMLYNGNVSLLHVAAFHNHLEVVKFLIEDCKLAINLKDNYNQTPLLLAAKYGALSVVDYLVNCANFYDYPLLILPVNANDIVNMGKTALILAIEKGHTKIANILLKASVSSGLREVIPESIGLAAKLGNIELVKILIEQFAVVINQQNQQGFTPLMLAANFGHLALVKYLLSLKSSSNNIDNIGLDMTSNEGLTALEYALNHNHIDIAILLIKFGAHARLKCFELSNLSIARDEARLCLETIASIRDLDVIQVLIKHNPTLSKLPEDDCIIMFNNALLENNLPLINYIVGSDKISMPHSLAHHKMTFKSLMMHKFSEVAIRLIERSIYPLADDILYDAVELGDLKVIQALYKKDGEILTRCRLNLLRTPPLAVSARSNQLEVLTFLLEKQSKSPDMTDYIHFYRALNAAINKNYTEIALALIDAREKMIDSADIKLAHFVKSSLFLVIQLGNGAVLQKLIEKDTNLLNIRDDENKTPLMRAAQNNDLAMILYLLSQKDIQLDCMDYQENTALHYAIKNQKNNEAVIIKLLNLFRKRELQIDPQYLELAAKHCRLEVVKYLLKDFPHTLNSYDYKDMNRFLNYIIQDDNRDVLNILIPQGKFHVDSLVLDYNHNEYKLLEWIIIKGYTEAALPLINNDVNNVDLTKYFSLAIINKNLNVMRLILKKGPSLLVFEDLKGRSVLRIFAEYSQNEIDYYLFKETIQKLSPYEHTINRLFNYMCKESVSTKISSTQFKLHESFTKLEKISAADAFIKFLLNNDQPNLEVHRKALKHGELKSIYQEWKNISGHKLNFPKLSYFQ